MNDKNNLYKLIENKLVLRNNKIINIKYIIEDNKEINEKIKLNIKYKIYNNKKELNENYEINALEIPEGNELSKLIIKDYLDKNKNLKEDEKTKIALKYQIFTENTSLFAELELSEKLTEEMKKEIIGDEKNNIISKINKKNYDFIDRDYCYDRRCCDCCCYDCCCDDDCCYDCCDADYCCECCDDEGDYFGSPYSGHEKEKNEIKKEKIKKQEVKKEKENRDNIEIKEIINEQNFVEGFWEINNKTKKIKEKYEKEFKLLKEIKNKNINDNIAITILIIYFIINKEHPELIDELFLIIKKAKKFIKENAKDSYENIIKEIGL